MRGLSHYKLDSPSPPEPDVSRFFDCGNIAPPIEQPYRSALPDFDNWPALIDAVRDELARLFGPRTRGYRPYQREHITLFHNTTGAFQHALTVLDQRFEGTNATLLTSDLEFTDCVAVVDQHWSGPVVVGNIAADLIEAIAFRPTGGHADELLSRALIRAYNHVQPRVVFLSHVYRSTGQVLSTDTLREFRRLNPRGVIILDGSQAIGNIVIEQEILDLVDFYVASGHKWLGGWTATGILWRQEPDPRFAGHQGGTGNDRAIVSLLGALRDVMTPLPKANQSLPERLRAIEERNRRLGAAFVRNLRPVEDDIALVTPTTGGRPPSGLVTIEVTNEHLGKRLLDRLEHEPFRFSQLHGANLVQNMRRQPRYRLAGLTGDSAPTLEERSPSGEGEPANMQIRFCFHYYHVPSDVQRLVQAIRDVV